MSRSRKTTRAYLASLWMVWGASVHAQTRIPGAPLPGLQSDPPNTVFPRSCSVTVSADRVSVDLSVRTEGDMPALFLEGPLFGWKEEVDAYPDRQFPELEVHVTNPPQAPDDRFEAWMGKRNITNLVRDAGMDPWAIARTPPATQAHPKNAQVLNGLRNIGAIEAVDDHYLAKWKARRLLRVPLDAATEQEVQLRYAPRPTHATSSIEDLITPARERDFCISTRQMHGALRRAQGAGSLDVFEYEIATAVDGNAPPAVTLTMAAGGGIGSSTAIFLCGPHGRAIAKRGSVTRQPAQVDEHGILHVLSVIASRDPSP